MGLAQKALEKNNLANIGLPTLWKSWAATPSLQSPPATRGGMAHEGQNDPVAQSSMYQRRPPSLTTYTADLSERDIKENPVVKEEETNDAEVFEWRF